MNNINIDKNINTVIFKYLDQSKKIKKQTKIINDLDQYFKRMIIEIQYDFENSPHLKRWELFKTIAGFQERIAKLNEKFNP